MTVEKQRASAGSREPDTREDPARPRLHGFRLLIASALVLCCGVGAAWWAISLGLNSTAFAMVLIAGALFGGLVWVVGERWWDKRRAERSET